MFHVSFSVRAALSAIEAGRQMIEEDNNFLGNVDGQLKSNIVPYPESDDDEMSNAREADPLSELQRQLNFLRNEFSPEVCGYVCFKGNSLVITLYM